MVGLDPTIFRQMEKDTRVEPEDDVQGDKAASTGGLFLCLESGFLLPSEGPRSLARPGDSRYPLGRPFQPQDEVQFRRISLWRARKSP